MPSACFDANSNVSTHWKRAEGMSLRYGVIVLGSLMRFFYQEIIISSGVFHRETASGFCPFGDVIGHVRGWRRDCVVGGMELVSNDARRTVAPPNAKHSTLPQGCFYVFVFDSIHDSATMHNLSPKIFH